jgi:anti-sigma B factor antagonist
MDINIRKSNDIIILDLKGDFDVNSANFIELMGDFLRQGVKKFVCNFENINMIDYMGLSGLAISYKDINNHTAFLKLCCVPVHVRNIFALLLLDSVFEMYVTEKEAIDSFSQGETFDRITKKKLRRRFNRLPIKVIVKFKPKFSSSEEIFEGKLLNLSAIGAFIYTKNIFKFNDILHVWMHLGSEGAIIEVDARVVWIADKQIQPQIYPGMGIEFNKISSQLQKKIVQFVDKNLSSETAIDAL